MLRRSRRKDRLSPGNESSSQDPQQGALTRGRSFSGNGGLPPIRFTAQPSRQTVMSGSATLQIPQAGPNIENVITIDAGPRSAGVMTNASRDPLPAPCRFNGRASGMVVIEHPCRIAPASAAPSTERASEPRHRERCTDAARNHHCAPATHPNPIRKDGAASPTSIEPIFPEAGRPRLPCR